jgi:hypothetical protein
MKFVCSIAFQCRFQWSKKIKIDGKQNGRKNIFFYYILLACILRNKNVLKTLDIPNGSTPSNQLSHDSFDPRQLKFNLK